MLCGDLQCTETLISYADMHGYNLDHIVLRNKQSASRFVFFMFSDRPSPDVRRIPVPAVVTKDY
jgi:hypothetical protein